MIPTAMTAEMRQMLAKARAETDPYEKVLARFEGEDTAVDILWEKYIFAIYMAIKA